MHVRRKQNRKERDEPAVKTKLSQKSTLMSLDVHEHIALSASFAEESAFACAARRSLPVTHDVRGV